MNLSARADALIAELRLQPHPEGGWYRRVYRSDLNIVRTSDGANRAAATTILYLLKAGEFSRWHRVASDEIWHFYEGTPVQLLRGDPALTAIESLSLGPLAQDRLPLQVIAARHWQAARPQDDGPSLNAPDALGHSPSGHSARDSSAPDNSAAGYSLVGCTVAPGFDFADFALMANDAVASAILRERHPQFGWLL